MTEFLFKETPTTEISSYCHTLALHDSLPIDQRCRRVPPDSAHGAGVGVARAEPRRALAACRRGRREGQPRRPTPSSLQIGRAHVCTPVTNAQLVFRLLLSKTKTHPSNAYPTCI